LPNYGAILDRWLRNSDGTVEVHEITFLSTEALDANRADPVRVKHLHLLEEPGAVSELRDVTDVRRP
jgi:hypothetical protein